MYEFFYNEPFFFVEKISCFISASHKV